MDINNIDLVQLVKDKFTGFENMEDLILILKNMGANQFQSVKAITVGLNIGLKEADQYVLSSIHWSSHKEGNIYLRDTFFSDEEGDKK